MSAVPKKKLCWNCEGNVARNIDNCPYCGVYLHASELEEENNSWNPSYRPSSKTEEIPTPIYQMQEEDDEGESQEHDIHYEQESSEKKEETFAWGALFEQLKRDLFPTLFLMAGSVFFLFGIVLLLFSQNGTLTLQWQWGYSFYFLGAAIPLIGFGWKYLQQLESISEKK